MSKIFVGIWIIKLIKMNRQNSVKTRWLKSPHVPIITSGSAISYKKEQTKCLSHSGSENCQRQLQHSATKLVLLCTAGNYVQNNQWRWVWTYDHGLPRHFHEFFTEHKTKWFTRRQTTYYCGLCIIWDARQCTKDVFKIFDNFLVFKIE